MAKIISDSEYADVVLNQHFARALEEGGVDDWNYYWNALNNYAENLGYESWDDLREDIIGE